MTITTIAMVFLAMVFVINIIQPLKYKSEFKLLIIQDNLNNNDPYLISKTTEYLGNVLTRVISSHSFFEKVINSGYAINKNYFGQSLKEQNNIWKNAVKPDTIEDLGILDINVYHKDREQATQIANAIATTLISNHKQYHGNGDNIEIKMIDDPLTSTIPVKPNILVNLLASLLAGMLFGMIYIYLFPEEKHDLRLMPKKKIKNQKTPEYALNEESARKIFENIIKENTASDNNNAPLAAPEKKNDNPESISQPVASQTRDDLDLDYERILQNGNIKNIL
jgi:capsular polysaccharide biosynthesis protein